MVSENERYPIGKFVLPALLSSATLKEWIVEIDIFPAMIAQEVSHLSDLQLDTPYREGGWTLRQVVHHCADSHINAFCRIKLTLTEEKPVIKPYDEAMWAELSDCKTLSVDVSLAILTGLHTRWTTLLNNLSDDERSRAFIHPELQKEVNIDEMVGQYAWHGKHHLAHITMLKRLKGWR